MTNLAATPEPPYVAVIFSATHTDDDEDYAETAAAMFELAARQPGYLGVETGGGRFGITVSYWTDDASARAWKEVAEHAAAIARGTSQWYSEYRVRVATVEREYGRTLGERVKEGS